MKHYIKRSISSSIEAAMPFYQVIVITGPRQVGKTTLCRQLFKNYAYFNLEDLSLREMALSDPKSFLQSCGNVAIIDEVQNLPNLMSYIQISVDENPDVRFVLTGSNNFSLMENITQSLAGRVALFTLLPFDFEELDSYPESTDTDSILYRGFYPAIFDRGTPPDMFYRNYYSTYVERDIRQLLKVKNLDTFHTFIRVCAARVGSELNLAAIGSATGVSAPTIREWLSILQESYIAFRLQPYYANINKRLTKTPKLYFYDTGLLCYLLGIENSSQLASHPLRGAVFENLAVIELIKKRFNQAKDPNIYFYRENSGKEVDIVQLEGLNIKLYEIKSSKTYNREFEKNINYLKSLLPDVISSATIVYDGQPMPPNILNIRDI